MNKEKTFYELLSKWYDETKFLSDPNLIYSNSHYQKILAMGAGALPFVINQSTNNHVMWCDFIEKVTGDTSKDFYHDCRSWIKKNGLSEYEFNFNPMTKFYTAFRRSRVVLPVIHVESYPQALKNAVVAATAGADGIWLISHGDLNATELFDVQSKLSLNFKTKFWVGVNCLDLNPISVFDASINGIEIVDENQIATMGVDNDGIWVDNAGIFEDEISSSAKKINDLRPAYNGLYFGGVAFKYQRKVNDYAKVAEMARDYVDVITTSGEATGQAADLNKIKLMYEASGDNPLALASGVTEDNIEDYLPYVNAFLVPTSINDDFHNLNLEKTRRLVIKVHGY